MIFDNTSIEELERQVAEAQVELEKYQCLLNELPGIYEEKFSQKVRSAAEDIRHLLDERRALQEQVSRDLMQPRVPEALPPAAEVPLAPVRRRWSYLRLPRFQSPFTATSSFGLPNGLKLGVLFGAGVALVLLVLGLPYLLNRRSLPLGGAPTMSNGSEPQASNQRNWAMANYTTLALRQLSRAAIRKLNSSSEKRSARSQARQSAG